jgi:hypothetical protein
MVLRRSWAKRDNLVAALPRMATVFEPIRPVPPMTTIFVVCLARR